MTLNALQPFANHLWQSTLFAAVTGLLTLALRSNRAQVRYGLWLAASMKFLIPFSILVAAGRSFALNTAAVMAPSNLSAVIVRVSLPLAVSVPTTMMPASQSSLTNFIPYFLCAAWAAGFVMLIGSWWLRWRSVRAALRTSSPLSLPIGLQVMTSPKFAEPGVFGILRPVLLLPSGITSHLTPKQLDAILKHELCHVDRRDNLASALHMLVEAVFWFHPLVWWLGARLMDERERACDEEVLRTGSEPQLYADSILRICELYLESPLQCVAGVTGGNLKKRIEEIMIGRIVFKLNFARKTALTLAGLIAVTIPFILGIVNAPVVNAQTPVAQWQTAAGGKMAFEVASVKQSQGEFTPPNFPLDEGNAYRETAGRFSADFPVIVYVQFAYKTRLTQEQMQAVTAHLPKWVANDRFVIQAKAPQGNPTKDQMRLMMQSLLAERFQLAIHFETREIPVLALNLVKLGKTGPKLRPHAEGPPCDASSTDAQVFPPICDVTSFVRQRGGNLAGSRNTTMELLASSLPALGNLGRPVVDRTGIGGKVDFRIDWIPEATGPANANVRSELQGPTFMQALHDQLGLKLESTRAPIQTLVIDRIERPSEN